ncbi:MAG: hypothetical protein FWD12_04470, partial [Alphaproteobacteria bacterium]|nr:hypothetical protein [Alphaproteobacteria bacterium]
PVVSVKHRMGDELRRHPQQTDMIAPNICRISRSAALRTRCGGTRRASEPKITPYSASRIRQ